MKTMAEENDTGTAQGAAEPQQAATEADVSTTEAAASERPPTPFEKLDAEMAAEAGKAPAPASEAAPAAAETADPGLAEKQADPTAEPAEQEAEPVAVTEPIVYEFTWPEAVSADTPMTATFTDVLREHSVPPEVGQKLLDLHAAAIQSYVNDVAPKQWRQEFNSVVEGWQTRTMADEVLGGAGYRTALQAAARGRDLLVSSAKPGSARYAKDLAEFQELDSIASVSAHPAMVRIFHNAARLLGSPQARDAAVDIKPSPQNGRASRGFYSEESRVKMNGR